VNWLNAKPDEQRKEIKTKYMSTSKRDANSDSNAINDEKHTWVNNSIEDKSKPRETRRDNIPNQQC